MCTHTHTHTHLYMCIHVYPYIHSYQLIFVRITSPNMLIFSPVTDLAVLSVFSKVGLFNFPEVRQMMIEISEPESSWNLMELMKISTVTYFLKFLLTISSD